jgi:hypothetical protein
MGFYGKGIDGRIDDPNGGWKGKGIYSTVATRAPFHMEGGKGRPASWSSSRCRPNPLAKVRACIQEHEAQRPPR